MQAAVGFPLHAPATVAGLARTSVRSVGDQGADAGALLVYGQGLGSIVVLEQKADPGAAKRPAKPAASTSRRSSIAGALGQRARHLRSAPSPRVTKGGVAYTVLGSVPAAAIEAAARDLVA